MRRAFLSSLCLIICVYAHTHSQVLPQSACINNNQSHPVADDIASVRSAPILQAEEVHISGSVTPPDEPLTLWYNYPAQNRTAGIAQDRAQFNHKTLWKGSSKATDLGSYLAFSDLYI